MIKKILIILLLLVLGGYFVVAITQFNKPSDAEVCQAVNLSVNDIVSTGFINSKEVEDILRANNLYPMGKRLKEIDTRKIEETLQKNPFISQVECYRSATGKICIEVTQRLPILHVMSNKGDNYYLDAQGHIMKPNTGTYAAHLAIVSGHVTARYAIRHLLPLGNLLQNDAFWNNMVEQINITEKGEVELIPRVGDHIVFIGAPNRYEDKLYRLKIFYEKALSEIGWNKYTRINVEFSNQIICTKRKD